MTSKYSLENLRRVFSDPSLIRSAGRVVYEDIFDLFVEVDRRWYCWRYGFSDDNIIDQNWDNLIILDAARPEFLDAVADDTLHIEKRESSASYSGGFIEKVLNDHELHDTVYVTANPYAEKLLDDDVFHAVIDLLDNDWNSESETVLPETVVKRTRDAREQFPKKRLLVHFMQPHHPFLGEHGKQIEDGVSQTLGQGSHPWNAQMYGPADNHETLIKAYRENHRIAIEATEDLLMELDGQSVVTADHANLIGERGFPIPVRLYGHHAEFPHPNLVSVPLVKREGEPREVVAEPPLKRAGPEESVIEDRLDALGYR